VRLHPDTPVTLQCNAGDIFAYQNPGPAEDTTEGAEFNLRRDLEILQKLDMVPGSTLPARALFHRVFDMIGETEGLCGYATVTSAAWAGCQKAHSGRYQQGRAKGIEALIPPRTSEEMQCEQQTSLAAMRDAEEISVRPHILVCSICQYGNGIRPPFPEDNLPDMLALVLREPDRRIAMAPNADWMMCAPCPYRVPDSGCCVIHHGIGGMMNQLRDLRVLQQLGLSFGDSLPAGELYRLIFDRIPDTEVVCPLDHDTPSIWHDPCARPEGVNEAYAKGKAALMEAMGIHV
jgi:hypothetical protein